MSKETQINHWPETVPLGSSSGSASPGPRAGSSDCLAFMAQLRLVVLSSEIRLGIPPKESSERNQGKLKASKQTNRPTHKRLETQQWTECRCLILICHPCLREHIRQSPSGHCHLCLRQRIQKPASLTTPTQGRG